MHETLFQWYTRRRAALVSVAGAALLLLWGASSSAQGASSGVRIDDADPESSVPSQEELAKAGPLRFAYLLMELSERAERAEKADDHLAAIKYFRALAKLVPEQATAFSKLCELYDKIGDRNGAVAMCRIATGLEGVKVPDYLRYVQLLMATPGGAALSPAEVSELDAVFQHLETQKQDGIDVQVLKCQVGVKLEDAVRMQECVQRLQAMLPAGDPIILPYRWSLALHEKNFALAHALVDEARKAALGAEQIEKMVEATQARQAGDTRGSPSLSKAMPRVLGLVLALASMLAFALWWSRRRRLTPAA